MPLFEADTRAKLLDAGLHTHGWTEDLIRREETTGAIEIIEGKPRKQTTSRVEYLTYVKVNPKAQPVAIGLAGYVFCSGSFVLVSRKFESPKRERGSVEISLAGASGSQSACRRDIKGGQPLALVTKGGEFSVVLRESVTYAAMYLQ
jgi:hypothetical protein